MALLMANIGPRTAGYFAGGKEASPGTTLYSEIDGVLFANGAAINPAATLSAAGRSVVGLASFERGYFGGGNRGSAQVGISVIDGIIFTGETAFTSAATLATPRYASAPAKSATHGYWMGGFGSDDPAVSQSQIDGLVFATDASNNPAATLVTAALDLAGTSSSTRGYAFGGYSTSTEIQGIQFSDESAVNPSASLTGTSRFSMNGSTDGIKGFLLGGAAGGAGPYADVSSFRYSDETVIDVTANLPSARLGAGSCDSASKGYVGGGFSNFGLTAVMNSVDSITFANEATATESATLAVSRGYAGGV